ncbi:hypothetical protein MBLNU457_5704t1 [Dothideomycetes sp. NU457]
MQSANRVQKALRKGGATFGAWQMLPGTTHSRILARTGVDWICIDTEHGLLSDASMHESVSAIAATGVSPVVRIPANEAWMVKRALDSGAHGIIVPLLQTADDARRLVSSAKFPPIGTRGFGSPFPMEKFHAMYSSSSSSSWSGKTGVTQTEYLQQANEALVTVVQIETSEALANVDAIAAVDGVDVLLIGPFDLGNNIGHPILETMDPELKDAIARIHAAAGKAGKRTGIYCTSGEQAREYADAGFHMISCVTDAAVLGQASADAVRKAQGGVLHSAYQGVKDGVSKMTYG